MPAIQSPDDSPRSFEVTKDMENKIKFESKEIGKLTIISGRESQEVLGYFADEMPLYLKVANFFFGFYKELNYKKADWGTEQDQRVYVDSRWVQITGEVDKEATVGNITKHNSGRYKEALIPLSRKVRDCVNRFFGYGRSS